MHRHALLLLVAALIAAAEASPQAPPQASPAHDATEGAAAAGENLCDLKTAAKPCSCNTDVIVCQCAPSFQILTVKRGSIPEAFKQTLQKFEARDCSSFSLLQGAFSSAPQLQMLHVSNVQNVTLNAGAIENLHTLMIDAVASLQLQSGSLQGVRGLSNIQIRKTNIPNIIKGALHNLAGIQELKLNEVEIGKIEKEAILIDMKPLGSKAEILQCKIKNIEEKGIQIGNGTDFIMNNTEIEKAESNSIRISSKHLMSLNGNIFHKEVHVNAVLIIFNETINFKKNSLANIDINHINMEQMDPFNPTYTLDRLSTLSGGNLVECKCASAGANITEPFKNNICIGGCSEATVASFLQSCQSNNKETNQRRLEILCENSRATTTLLPSTTATHAGNNSKTVKTGSGVGKNSARVLPILVVYLFHLIW